ncbi:MAG: trimethylamine methyltransferase family protein [Deltaproteobacteria bacterium]|jgi:trimethylamine--corrinoid protein Co-methyltransferase|nr:trimethylamine methyltransferase family protein [Deltaproteobacteria bacterium]
MRVTLEALSPSEIENAHQATLDILAESGLAFMSEAALETFRHNGFSVDGQRVRFTQGQIEAALSTAPGKFSLTSRNPGRGLALGLGEKPVLLSASGVPKIIDRDGSQRAVNFGDYRDMLKLTQTSPVLGMSNSGALYPEHGNPELALYLMVYHTLAMTDMPLVGQSEGQKLSAYSIDMAQAASGITDKPVMVGVCNSLSPMAWDSRMLEGIKAFAERGQALNVSCCAMCGATAPVYAIGAIVQANCEVLGGLAYSQLVRPGTPVIYGTTSSVMDMGTMGLALGAPEYTLVSVGCAQMASRYGLPYRGGGGLTDAKELDAQAGLESAWNLVFSYFEGVHFMLQAVGVMESFMSVAFDKWVLDEEIVSRALRLSQGLGPFPADLAETFRQGIEASGYLKLKSTLRGFRKEFYRPTLGDRRNFESYRQKGSNLQKDAWDLVEGRLAGYQRPAIEARALADMGKIFEKATGQPAPGL